MLPFWAPDNRTVAFFTTTDLKAVDDSGELPQTLGLICRCAGRHMGRRPIRFWWQADRKGALYRIAASGGQFEELAVPDAPSKRFAWPLALPDQRWLLLSEIDLKASLRPATVSVRSLDGRNGARCCRPTGLRHFPRPTRCCWFAAASSSPRISIRPLRFVRHAQTAHRWRRGHDPDGVGLVDGLRVRRPRVCPVARGAEPRAHLVVAIRSAPRHVGRGRDYGSPALSPDGHSSPCADRWLALGAVGGESGRPAEISSFSTSNAAPAVDSPST